MAVMIMWQFLIVYKAQLHQNTFDGVPISSNDVLPNDIQNNLNATVNHRDD